MAKRRNRKKAETIRKRLRAGSKEIKAKLYEKAPYCDICHKEAPINVLDLHHIYLIRHGFKTEESRCVLLCPTCHRKFHVKYDSFLDSIFETNPDINFGRLYEAIKNKI